MSERDKAGSEAAPARADVAPASPLNDEAKPRQKTLTEWLEDRPSQVDAKPARHSSGIVDLITEVGRPRE